MSWEHDPEIAAKLIEHRVRNGLIRSAVIWTPLFLVTAGGCLFYIADQVFSLDKGGTWFLVVVLAVLALLFGFQAFQALLDLRASPEEESGTVSRRWSRSDSLVMRSHYIRIGDHILRGDLLLLDGVKEGDEVRVRYFPHSAVLVAVEKLKKTATPE